MKYPKIQTIWKRDKKNKNNIIPGDFSKEEFNSIKLWKCSEKIDGTNIRISYEKDVEEIWFGGRTDDAQIPVFLLEFLQKTFTKEKMKKQFKDSNKVILFGEGYGPKIQSVGKQYREDVSFILFDVWIDGWWLEPDKVKQLAEELGIDYVPELGVRTINEIITLVKSGFPSSIAKFGKLNAEGIVARSHPLMLFRDGTPIMFKIKHKDYLRLK